MGVSMNKVILAGNLTRDPEQKFLPSGQCIANMRMACNRKFKASSGEFKEEVTYVGVEVWGKQAESCGEFLKKGSPLLVEGRLKLNEWTTQDGQKRSMLSVVAERVQFIGGRTEGGASSTAGQGHAQAGDNFDEPWVPSADDIPF